MGVGVGDDGVNRPAEVFAEGFVAGEEEGLVAVDGSADGAAELVADILEGIAAFEEVTSVELAVADILTVWVILNSLTAIQLKIKLYWS